MSYCRKPYEFRFENNGTTELVYARFYDVLNRFCEVEVSFAVHRELELLNRSIQNIERSNLRRIDRRSYAEEEFVKRVGRLGPSAEDVALKNIFFERLRLSFLELSPVQARRFLLAHGLGYSYAEIAQREGCSINAIKKSLVAAKKKLQRIL